MPAPLPVISASLPSTPAEPKAGRTTQAGEGFGGALRAVVDDGAATVAMSKPRPQYGVRPDGRGSEPREIQDQKGSPKGLQTGLASDPLLSASPASEPVAAPVALPTAIGATVLANPASQDGLTADAVPEPGEAAAPAQPGNTTGGRNAASSSQALGNGVAGRVAATPSPCRAIGGRRGEDNANDGDNASDTMASLGSAVPGQATLVAAGAANAAPAAKGRGDPAQTGNATAGSSPVSSYQARDGGVGGGASTAASSPSSLIGGLDAVDTAATLGCAEPSHATVGAAVTANAAPHPTDLAPTGNTTAGRGEAPSSQALDDRLADTTGTAASSVSFVPIPSAGESPKAPHLTPLTPTSATGKDATPASVDAESKGVLTASQSALPPALQQMISPGTQSVGVSRGLGRAAPTMPVTGVTIPAAGQAQAPDDAADGGGLSGLLGEGFASAAIEPTSVGPTNGGLSPLMQAAHLTGIATAPESGPEEAGARSAPIQAGDIQAAAAEISAPPVQHASAAAPHQSLAVNGGPALSVATQILPAVVTMAQGHGAEHRLSVSITPDELGKVSITIDRAIDGTTTIQVAAERQATLDLLQRDRSELVHALDQAGIRQENHSLSFSLDGGNGGMGGWGNQGDQPSQRWPASAAQSYADESDSNPTTAAAARGGIDLTA